MEIKQPNYIYENFLKPTVNLEDNFRLFVEDSVGVEVGQYGRLTLIDSTPVVCYTLYS